MSDRKLNICFGGTAPWLPYGYGVTTGLVAPRLRDRLGHEVSISAYYGLPGGKLIWNGIPVYPSGFGPFGNDIHAANARQVGADILLTHQDVWPQNPAQLTANGTRWVVWAPIDSEPIAPQIALRMQECYQAITLSHFGQRQAAAAGLDLPLVVQGIDTTIFTPGSKSEARERLGWPHDAFIVGMVAMNTGYPSRKAYPQQLEAFGQFFQHHRDAMIYLHCYGEPEMDENALPLVWHLERYGAQQAALWADPYQLNVGYTQAQMVDRYRAFDALLCVSMSEGFGIPLIEAQACGCPVIVGDWTAMAENCYAGWKVAREDSEPWPASPLRCFWRLPHIGAITEQLEIAYSQAHMFHPGMLHTTIVEYHDQDMLVDTQWRAVLQDIAQRIETEPTPWHRHRWASYGHQNGRGLIVPCLVKDCPAERAGDEIAPAGFLLVIDGISLDIEDDPNGGVKHEVAHEITSVYRLQDLTFAPGDVVIDVGAHVGVVSCYLAKKWPGITIYAFEPIPANYARLERNIRANGLANVRPFRGAITAQSTAEDGVFVVLSGDPRANTGHYSAYAEHGPVIETAPTSTLSEVMRTIQITRVALLKIDCEGAEYEILYGMGDALRSIGALVMEVHENAHLADRYGGGAQLVEYAKALLRTGRVRASIITMPDAERAAPGHTCSLVEDNGE